MAFPFFHRRALSVWLLGWAAAWPLHAADAASLRTADLATTGAGPYFTLHLPMALQTQATSADWSDLQVVNAGADVLPFAWIEAWPATATEHQQAAHIFRLPGAASGASTGPSRGWMLDARGAPGSLLRLDLVLPETSHGLYTLSVEAGDDLQHWRTVQPSVQVLSLQHQGQRLSSTTVDLGAVRARYLRLTALPGSHLPELASAQVTSLSESVPALPMQWSDPIAPDQCGERHCDYTLPRHVPVEQLQVLPSEANTVARIEFLGRIDPTAATPRHHRHGVRERVKALRRKGEPAPGKDDASWLPLQTANVYWLRLPDGEARSGALWLDGDLHSQLRLRTIGPISQWGARPPTLRVGAHTRSLVFLARGPAPYRLSWGASPGTSSALPIGQLIPTRKSGDPLPADIATAVLASPVAAASAAALRAPAAAALTKRDPQLWLWGALLTGLALMGFMAWSLLRPKARDVGASRGPDAPPPA